VLSRLESALSEWVPRKIEPLVSTGRVGQFVAVGAGGVAVELATLTALVELAGAGELLAGVAGKEAAILVMFALNERWTFADSGARGPRALARRIVTSHLARSVGTGVALAVYTVLLVWVGVWYFAAALVGIAAGFLFNYLGEGLFTWRTHLSR